MFHRIAILSVSLLFLSAATLNAGGDFPKTAEDYASLYEMQLYQRHKGNSQEYRRQIEVSKQVIRNFKKAGKNADEQTVINWYRTASHSGFAPAPLSFSTTQSDAPAATADSYAPAMKDSYAPEAVNSYAPAQSDDPYADLNSPPADAPKTDPSEQAVQPEYDWDQAEPADGSSEETEPGGFAENDEKQEWSPRGIDAAYGSGSKNSSSSSSESLVTSDPKAADVMMKSKQVPTTTPKSSTDGSETKEMPDLSSVFGGVEEKASEAKSDTLAAAGNIGDAVADVAADAGDFASDATASGGISWPPVGAGAGATPTLGMAPMALLGVGAINAIIGLICMIKQLMAAFKNSTLLGIISLVFCGIGGLIIGWIKHKEWGLTKTMKIWTGATVLGIILQFAAGFLAVGM